MNLGKGEWALGRGAEQYESVTKACLGVVRAPRLSSCDKSQSLLIDETPEERIYKDWFPSGGSASWQIGDIRESLFLHALLFKCLQVKVINIPKQLYFGVDVLDSCRHIWGGMVCCPSALNQLWNLKQVTFLPWGSVLPLQNEVALSCWMGKVL